MRNTASTFEDRLDSLKDSMRHLVDLSGEHASALKDSVVAGSKTGVKKVGSLIKDHPFIAIGVAFGVGYLVMRIVKR
jgi:ElaB/YqjD/DUF883 family membrane-anchored ribosome-binding protein